MSRFPSHPRRTFALGVALVLCATLSSCGSRLSDQEVLAQQGVAAEAAPNQTGTVPGAVDTGAAAAPSATDAGQPAVGGATASGGPVASAAPGAKTPTGKPGGQAPAAAGKGSTTASGPATGSVVNVGNIGLYSGLLGEILGTVRLGTQVAVSYLNNHGGLNGHRINLITADDGGDPSTALSIAKRMIEQDKVVAFLNNMDPLVSNSLHPYVKERGVATIGGIGLEPEYYTNPLAFPSAASPRVQAAIGVKELVDTGKDKVGFVYCVEFNLICSNTADAVNGDVPKFGGKVVYKQQVSLAQPDYSSQCLAAKSAGVTNMLLLLDPNSLLRFVNSCATQGFKPQYSTVGVVLDKKLLTSELTEGMIAASSAFPFPYQGPETAAFRKAFQDVTGAAPATNLTATAWLGALVLQAGSASLSAAPTPAEVIAGLYAMKKSDYNGLASIPLSYRKGEATPSPTCGFIVAIKDGAFVAPNGLKRSCVDAGFGQA